jgi:hypothetical protein
MTQLLQFAQALQTFKAAAAPKPVKGALPALTQTYVGAQSAQEAGEVIRSAWVGYGDGPGGVDNGVYKLTIKNNINTFKAAMRYLRFAITDNADGTTTYLLNKSPFAIATKVVDGAIKMVVWDTRGGQSEQPQKPAEQTPALVAETTVPIP